MVLEGGIDAQLHPPAAPTPAPQPPASAAAAAQAPADARSRGSVSRGASRIRRPDGGDDDGGGDDDDSAGDEGGDRGNSGGGDAIRGAPWELLKFDLRAILNRRLPTIRDIPTEFKGPYRQALVFTMRAVKLAVTPEDQHCTWALWMLLPRMLLATVSHAERERSGLELLRERFRQFWAGDWTPLLANAVAVPRRRVGSQGTPPDAMRMRKVLDLIKLGELSRARSRLAGSVLAPLDGRTLASLRAQREAAGEGQLSAEILNFVPAQQIELDRKLLVNNVRGASRGSAHGASGHRFEHFRLLLEDPTQTSFDDFADSRKTRTGGRTQQHRGSVPDWHPHSACEAAGGGAWHLCG